MFAIVSKAPPNDLMYVMMRRLVRVSLTMAQYMGDELEIEHYFNEHAFADRQKVFSVHEPCRTITGKIRPIAPGCVPHPNDTMPLDKVRQIVDDQ